MEHTIDVEELKQKLSTAQATIRRIEESNNQLEQAIAHLFPDEFPIYAADAGGDGRSRCIGDHVPGSMVMMLCQRFSAAQARVADLEKADRVWDKHSLTQLVQERKELRERVAALMEALDVARAGIDDGLSALNSSAILLTRVVEAKEALLPVQKALSPAKETA